MISESEYSGIIPYKTYVKRYKKHLEALPVRQLPKDSKKEQENTIDIPPTQDEIKDYINKNKIDINEKTKNYIKKTIESKTGSSIDDINNTIDEIQDELADTEKGKEKRKQIVKGLQLSRALKPNTEDLLPIERVRAKFSQAGKLAYMNDDNYNKAQAFIDGDPDIPNGYTIDKNLSTKEGLVIRTPDGKTEINYRGSQILDKTSFEDLGTNFKMITGFENEDPQFVRAKNQFQETVNKYGSVEHISGFSKGGGKGLYIAQKFDVPSTTFNPVIGTKTARGITNTTKEHTIIRSTNDPTSIGLAVSSNANHENWNVKSLKPLKQNTSLVPGKEMYLGHKLDNFTIPRNTGNTSTSPHALERLPIKVASLGNQMGQYQELDRIGDYIKNNKSYSDYYFDLQKGSKNNFLGDGDVSLVNGKPLIKRQSVDSTRHIEDKGMAKLWKTMGGKFTDEEQSIFDSANQISTVEQAENFLEDYNQDGTERISQQLTPPKEEASAIVDSDFEEIPQLTGLNEEQLNNYSNANTIERQNILSDHLEDMTNSIHELGSHTAPMEASGFREHLAGTISGTNLARGMLVGLGVDEALSHIPVVQKLSGVSREAVSGGISGGLSSALATGLGGLEATTLAPEILAGSAGYIAGSEGGKLIGKGIKKLGGNEDAQSAGSDVGGGFLGGLASAGTAIGAGTLLGAEIGEFGGPLGLALGAGLGTAGGLLAFTGEEIYNHKDDIGKGITKVGDALIDTGEKIGGFFKSIF